MLEFIMEKYPGVSKSGASTFLTDLLNPKYSHWKERGVVKSETGKLVFKDKVPDVVNAAVSEVQSEALLEEKSNEQPAE